MHQRESAQPRRWKTNHRLQSSYEIFKIRLFQEYRKYVRINSLVAGTLGNHLSDDCV